MSPNSDNAMARFLFAILKQKNLKDIDWNQVAADPVLIEPITNGHAARMRYSRFRATVTGHTPSKRGRPSDKSKVSKSKKGAPTKKEKPIKQEPGSSSLAGYPQFSPESLPSLTSPYMPDCDDFAARFLTPCSDDMTQALSMPPSLESIRHPSSLMFPPLDGNSDFLNHTGHGGLPSTSQSAFDMAYDLSGYPGDVASQGLSHTGGSQPLGDWDDRLNDHHF
ncbi:hypothetical protein BBK36DRAFT_1115582 [Trichoderma citrinoviride]|uniref:Myb-like DNA-binding domain-containing protein n=1 Tax=Trichoderma citrinoviride TaxID=58853 RepID=A0A2T4BDU6_9HYPO|nr:hypothetical protein BBK36DRAFT_1115582 [Trichoderma citrinoviride]PTB67507.1 hypothetical protein BBK36DRAFT_1115582 [Trichoderma citrinoviride]